MASHHHRCNPHQHHHAAAAAASCCCYSCCTTTPSHPTPPPPSLLSTDPLLQALASQILLQQSPQLHHPHYPAHLQPTTTHHHLQPQHHQHHKKQQIQHQQEDDHQTHTVISSLLNRIDALESSLRRLSSSSSSSPYRRHSTSIRDVAARTIQTHFRAFLVRRSRTLRNLKDLALIKSAFITLKSSISDQTHLDPEALSRKTMDLLFDLDSIQGGDPMIRDGKRSISSDLVRFLDLIDVKRHEFLTKAVKNVRFVQNRNKSKVLGTNCRGLGGRDQRETMDKLRDRVRNIEGYARVSENDDDDGEEEVELEGFHQGSDDEQTAGIPNYGKNEVSQFRNGSLLKRHGVQSRLKKCVSFADDGNAARVFASRSGVEEIGSFSKEAKAEAEAEDEEETTIESGGSDQTSDSEENPRRNSGAEGNSEISGHYQGQHGNLSFSAPELVKMESRDGQILKERLRRMEEAMIGKK